MLSTVQILPQQTSQKRKSNKPEVVITKRAQEILEAIHTYRFVTAWDITRLFYSATSINHVRELLALLSGKNDYQDRTYLYRFPLPTTRIGNSEKIYTLGSRGRAYLQSCGMDSVLPPLNETHITLFLYNEEPAAAPISTSRLPCNWNRK